jgi:transcriptional regulator with XRE-family HTH domain
VVPTFAELLREFRQRAGLSQRGLAAASAINPAIISRLESEDRGPSGPEQVLAIARALSLGDDDADRLLASAGYWPRTLLALGPQDPTVLAVARLLASPRVSDPARARFRRAVDILVEQWLET